MTTIVAIQHDTDVEYAWDSRVTIGGDYADLKQPKVFGVGGGLVFGVSGSLRALDSIRTAPFPEYDGSDAHSWLVVKVVPVLRQIAERDKWWDDDSGMEANILVTIDGESFGINRSLAVDSQLGTYRGVGSGADYALGALAAGATPEDAIRIAAEFDAYSGGRITRAMYSELVLDD